MKNSSKLFVFLLFFLPGFCSHKALAIPHMQVSSNIAKHPTGENDIVHNSSCALPY